MFSDAGLGLTRGEVCLVPSDPSWESAYERLALELRSALGGLAIAVEHIGSTAVPGLPAKPILDVAVSLRAGAEEAAAGVLEAVGFIPRGAPEGGVAAMFGWEDEPRHRVVNLHVVPYDGPLWRDWVLFRDRLRADAGVRDAYAALKADLARTYPDDRKAYIAGKDAFVRRVLAG